MSKRSSTRRRCSVGKIVIGMAGTRDGTWRIYLWRYVDDGVEYTGWCEGRSMSRGHALKLAREMRRQQRSEAGAVHNPRGSAISTRHMGCGPALPSAVGNGAAERRGAIFLLLLATAAAACMVALALR